MKRFILLALSILFIVGCSGERASSPVTVSRKGGLFVNDFFGLSVTKPEGWYAQNVAETMGLIKGGTEQIAKDDRRFQARIKEALERTVPVFGFFEFQPGTTDRANPNVIASAESLRNFPGITSGCAYLAEVRKSLAKAPVIYTYEGECRTRKIGGKDFDFIKTTADYSGVKVYQVFYATIDRKYALVMVQTYTDAAGFNKTNAIISSLKFQQG